MRTRAVVVAVFLSSLAIHARDIGHLGVDQRVLVICVKYSDIATTRMTRCSDWVNTLNTEIRLYFSQATFGLTTLRFLSAPDGMTNGWHDLGFGTMAYDFNRIAARAIRASRTGIPSTRAWR